MRQTNPWEQFFVNAVLPEDGEIGDAFWGYHTANNIARLMNVDGTLFFPPVLNPTPVMDEYYREAYIPTSQLSFHAAPVIQFSVHYPGSRTFSRTTGISVPVFGLTLTDVPSWDNPDAIDDDPYNKLTIQSDCSKIAVRFDDELGYYVPDWSQIVDKFYGRLGTDEEIMIFIVDSIELAPGESWPDSLDELGNTYLYIQCTIERGKYGTDIELHSDGLQVYRVDDITVTETVTPNIFLLNPPWVQGILDAQKLTVRWMSKESGTVYFKIFGV